MPATASRAATPAPTSKDVARVAGVSQSTVSYVLSGKRPISDKTRQLVLDAIAKLTYEPNAGARALAGRRTNVIGLMVPFRSAAQASGLMAFAEEIALGARQRDHDVLLLTADEGPAGLERVARRAICDAVIAMQVDTIDRRAEVARRLGIPVIFIGFPADDRDLHCIDFDFETAARLLVAELAGAGADRITVLGWGADEPARINFIPRFRASAADAATELGLPLRWIPTLQNRDDVERVVQDEVLAGNARSILSVHSPVELSNSLQRAGLTPGRDLDLVALCTDAHAELQHVPPTAVSPQPRDVSRRAIDWVFEMFDGDAPPQRRLVQARLTRRGSVRTPA